MARFKRSRPPLKGRKNKRRYKVDSDWQDYYGSSDDLTMDVNKLGKENSPGRYCFGVGPRRNCHTWRHVNSLHVRCLSQTITTTAISV